MNKTSTTCGSILAFEDRGPWGRASWRGNCSGHVYQSLFAHYQPAIFVDPMVGSGTSVEVARELGIEAYGLDLHSGFNILRDSILRHVGKEADLVFSHPPYHDLIVYSGEVWGRQGHPDDLSRCADDEDFLEKLTCALLNQREATRPGGMYGLLIGDLRRSGKYSSYQAECIARMPRDELAAVMIKAQINCASDRTSYHRQRHPRISHEYILLWEKPRRIMSILSDLAAAVERHTGRARSTWRACVRLAMLSLGGHATLAVLYRRIAQDAPERLAANRNWQAKVRQVLQQDDSFEATAKGHWALRTAA